MPRMLEFDWMYPFIFDHTETDNTRCCYQECLELPPSLSAPCCQYNPEDQPASCPGTQQISGGSKPSLSDPLLTDLWTSGSVLQTGWKKCCCLKKHLRMTWKMMRLSLGSSLDQEQLSDHHHLSSWTLWTPPTPSSRSTPRPPGDDDVSW